MDKVMKTMSSIVLPDAYRADGVSREDDFYAAGYNACREEVLRLNSAPQGASVDERAERKRLKQWAKDTNRYSDKLPAHMLDWVLNDDFEVWQAALSAPGPDVEQMLDSDDEVLAHRRIAELEQQLAARQQGSAAEAGRELPNGGMHDSIFVKVWGDAGGGDAGRRALAQYAYELGAKSVIPAPAADCAGLVEAVRLLKEVSATLKMWADVAPAVSLRADIAKFLAGLQGAKGESDRG